MSSALKQPTVVVLLPHELAAIVRGVRAFNEFCGKHPGSEHFKGDELKKMFGLAMDVVEAANTALHHAIEAPEPENVMVLLGAPLHIHEGEK